MKTNEYIDEGAVKAREELARVAQNKQAKKKQRTARSSRVIVQIMNGEFLSKENFVKNLPFTFFLGFLLVVLIGWGYYAETITKKEVKLEKELGELNSEFFTLGSKFNSKRGRRTIADKLTNVGVKESLTSPRKIRVKKFVFENGR